MAYEQRLAEGYQFRLEVEERVVAFEAEGWERMTVDGHELWWKNQNRVPCVFLMRRSA